MAQWRAALRQVLHRPGFALTATLLLAAGIGANTTIFSIVDTVLLKSLPYPAPDRLVFLLEANSSKRQKESLIAPPRLQDWSRLNATFSAMAGYYSDSVTDTSAAVPERLAALRVSPGYFSVYRLGPLLGRTFNAREELSDGPPAAVISYGLWSRRFNKARSALGKRLVLGKEGYTVIGVMPESFAAPNIDLWLSSPVNLYLAQARDARFYSGIGRMKPGITLQQAQDDLRRVQTHLAEQYPGTDKNWSVIVRDLKQQIIGDHGKSVWLTFGATALLLLLSCTNVAGLVLGHLYGRERELAIRASLGASRRQVISTLLQEIFWIASAGVALGIVFSIWSVTAAARFFSTLPRISSLQVDWRCLSFAAILGCFVLLLVGLVPSLQATSGRLSGTLNRGGRSLVAGTHKFHSRLLILQLALTVVLLSSAGLLLRSFLQLTSVNIGYDPTNVLTFRVGAEWSEDRVAVGKLQSRVLSELTRLPNVEAAGITNFLPTDQATLRYQYEVQGLPGPSESNTHTAGSRTVSSGYLAALHIPLLSGSTCPVMERNERPLKALVNREFIQDFAGGRSLLGKRISIKGTDVRSAPEIIGVIGSVREDGFRMPESPYVYVCSVPGGWPDPDYVVRVRGDAKQFAAAVRTLVGKIAPARAVFATRTMEEHVAASLDQPRITVRLLLLFAVAALALAAFGLYSLMTLIIVAKTRDIGTRIALGARSADVLAHVFSGAGQLIIAGLCTGLALSLAVWTILRSLLFGVSPVDPATLTVVALVLVLACALSIVLPALRAIHIDPQVALRAE